MAIKGGGRRESDNNDDDMEAPLLASDSFVVDLLPTYSNTTSQVALVGAEVCPIESLDYELVENDLFKQDWRSRSRSHIFQYVVLKWAFCFLIGVLAGGTGFLTNLAIENVAGAKFVVTSNMMLAKRYELAFAVFAASNFVLTMFAAGITVFFAPEAAGSGIPEVKAYLNGVDAPGIFSLRTLVVKVIGTIAAVSSSLHIGKAGPLVHTGACFASILGQGGSRRHHLTCKWFRYFKNDRDRRDLVTCGAGAGIAAAFRAPVGGVLFALEAVSSWWRISLLWRAFFTTAVVAVVLRALIDVCKSGKCGLFVYTTSYLTRLFGFTPALTRKVRYTNYYWRQLCRFARRVVSSASPGWPRVNHARLMPLRHAPPLVAQAISKSTNVPLATTIRNLYSAGTDDVFQPSSIITFFVASYFLGILSYGIAAPSGLFVPVILTGATYGRLIGMLMGSYSNLDHGLFAVLGSASLLGGSMRITVSVCIMLLELTDNLLLLPLVMLVLLISKTVADVFTENVYDLLVKLKGFPYLETHAEPYMRQLTVADVVTGPLQVFNGVEKVGNIVHVLRTTGHNGFPVVDEPPFSDSSVLYGLILRAHLIVLLKKKKFVHSCTLSGFDTSKQFCADDFGKRGSMGNNESIEDLKLSEEEMEMYVDLHPFTNTSPYTVVETMSLAKALILFREVGLRHLLVIPKSTSYLVAVQRSAVLIEGPSCWYIDEARFHARAYIRTAPLPFKQAVAKASAWGIRLYKK
ncbi:Chloride channel protein [Rhynchospora pubera]|uniref:Chloride channel protein n=1 Tax=Rhynchospora pubera TaxID=906938 RepID=A0AAV8GE33_9POAL|nr:Chloride channel protein [Rhynchospora pubera]